MIDEIRIAVGQALVEASDGKITLHQAYDSLVEPPDSKLGDLAFGCFQLAKELRQAPPQIAAGLSQKIKASSCIKSCTATGPYLNFTIQESFLGVKLLQSIQRGAYFEQKLTSDTPKTMVEFSQPNTHKELHVGHMRNACLGDALVRTMRYAGYDIISSTFPGDVGTHVAKCLWYLKYRNIERPPQVERGEWLGKLYSKGHLQLEDEEKTDKAETNKKQMTEILRQLEAKSGEFYELWKETRQWSIELMNEVYTWCGIRFDQWYWESEVDSASVAYAKELFKQGKLVESQGAIGMNLEDENLGFCLLVKSDGNGLYATKDIELARRKFQDFHIEKSIYVVDMRQALHFKQVFKVLEKIGFKEAKNCYHLQYNFVELPDGAMSSRKGNIVPIIQLIHKMEQMVKDQYLSRYAGEWTQAEIDLVATQVAQGAIKYGMVKIDNNKKIVFDMNEWLKIDGDSGPFIQYSSARIHSLCRKLGYDERSVNWSLLVHASERQLMQSMMNFHQVVIQAAETYRPSIICTYLYDLAKRFNLFYHECSIGQAGSEDLMRARLALSYCVGEVLSHGLGLLGIPTPERM
ncbi:MAG: arginine--tRNA ligase [Oligoflexia bacterium]|nr:MAG: arginine--tRNA ligase [Oligoflexia bacterium]